MAESKRFGMVHNNYNTKPHYMIYLLTLGIVLMTFTVSCKERGSLPTTPAEKKQTTIKLPTPRYDSDVSIEKTLLQRRSIRTYTKQPLTLQEISQLLWAAQGITSPEGFRTAPSAGALYPLELYVVVGNVVGLSPGVYRYKPDGHQLLKTIDGDKRVELARASLGQRWVKEGAVCFVFTAVYERTTIKYGDRGIRYVDIEVGHAAQNLCLQAVALGIGTVPVGAFFDEQVTKILALPKNEVPLYIIPAGKK